MIETKYKIKEDIREGLDSSKVRTLNFESDYNREVVSRTESLEGVLKRDFEFNTFFPYQDDNGSLKGFTNLGNDVNTRWNIGHMDNYDVLVQTWTHEMSHNWYPEEHEINIRMRTRTGGYG